MCELLGLSFSECISPTFSFAGLLKGSPLNPDGWGVSFYPNESKSATIFKEPITANSSQLAKFLFSYSNLRSKLFLAHIRNSSAGTVSHADTHPFSRCYNSLEWLFAHNGTLHSPQYLAGLTYIPVGQTDSERAFCFLLSEIRKQKITPVKQRKYCGYSQTDFEAIYEILMFINEQGEGAFNTVFADGTHLFAYRDVDGARPLYYLKRSYPFSQTALRDSELSINLNLEKGHTEKGYVVASACLSSEDWQSFEPGQLIVFRDGQIIEDFSP